MVTFNNFGNRYEPSVHTGRRNVAARYEARAASKAAAHIPQGTETTNIKINYGPSKNQVIGGLIGLGISKGVPYLLRALGIGKSSNVSQVQNTYVPTSSVSNSSTPSNTATVSNSNSRTIQTDTAPKASDIDTSGLPSGASISDVSQGTVDGTPSYVATVRNNDGTTSTYSVIKDSNGKYKIGAQLSKQKGNNYVNQEKLNAALEKAFGKGFELPEGYTAELVGDTPIIKDAKGKTLNSTELSLLKSNEEIAKEAKNTSDSEDVERMMKEADQNGDKSLNSDEYKAYITGLLDAAGIDTEGEFKSDIEALIDASFQSIDGKDKNGLLSNEELKENAPSVIKDLTNKIGKLYGINMEGDSEKGKIDVNMSVSSPEEVMEIADLDGNGTIDKSEFEDMKQSAKELGFEMPVDKSFEELDANNDGTISQDELSQQ